MHDQSQPKKSIDLQFLNSPKEQAARWDSGNVVGNNIPKHFHEEREYWERWLEGHSPLNYPLLNVQKKSVAAAAALKFALIWDDMGLGKTAQALAVDLLNGNKHTVIFCPNNVKKVWLHEIEKFTGTPTNRVFIGSGSDFPVLTPMFVKKFRYLVFNYEALMIAGKMPKAKTPGVFSVCTHHILDEAHNFRNPRTQRFRAYIKYLQKGKVRNMTVLTGTPIDRCINEIWPYLAMMDMCPYLEKKEFYNYFRNFSQFSDRYALASNVSVQGQSIVKHRGYKKAPFPEIENILGRKAIQRKIEDVVELPEVDNREIFLMDNYFKVDMAKLSQQFQATFSLIHSKKGLYDKFMKGDMDSIAAIQKLRVQLAEMKVKYTYDMGVKYLEKCKRVIIFSEFIRPLQMFEELAKSYSVSYAVGRDMTLAEREASVQAFKDGKIDFLLATFGALSEGENLQQCQAIIMNDLPWQPLVMTQASRRIWRIGQKKKCHIVRMTCTADKSLQKIISNKQEMVSEFEKQLANIKRKFGYF